MQFAEPIWLLVGAVTVTMLVILLARAEHLRTRALAQLGAARFGIARARLPSRLRRWLRVAVMAFAVAMGFVALARPQKGLRWETVERTGTDVLLVVDTSHSMDADDVKPTRLERSKLAIRDFVDKFPGNRVGLVAFAGDAFVQSPMTLDHSALLETVDALDTSIVARGGTNIGRAIDVATEALATEPNNQKAMVLLTDGEDLEGQGLAEAKRAAAAGIIVDTIGVGSTAGELVPQKDERGRAVGVVRDESGKPVRSRLDEAGLRAIADAAHGTYRPLGADGRGLDRLYEESLKARTHQEASSRTHRVYAEWFRIPLGLALGAVVLDAFLGLPWRRTARNSRGSGKARSRAAATATAGVAAALLLLLAPGVARASVADAQKAYAAGKFDDAQKQYEAESAKHPKDATLAFNAGDAAYKAGHYEAAEAAFKRALAAGDPALQQHVLYNQGDSLYRFGEGQPADARARKKEAWTAAVAAYEGALALNPKDADAKYNRDFVKRKLKELEEKPQDQPKPQDQKQQPSQAQNGQQPKDQGQNGNQPKDQAGGQQANGKQPVGQQPNGQQANGQQPNGQQSTGQQPNGQQPNGQQPNGQQPNGKLPGARLSEQEARALLGALKGEERHAVRRGVDGGAPIDDAPRKDW